MEAWITYLDIQIRCNSIIHCDYVISVYKSVLKTTVYEIAINLLDEPYQRGMDDPESLTYFNMSDQMIHLVKFES